MSSLALRTRWLVSDSLVLAGRSLEHVRQIPEKLLDVTLQPIMFVLLFTFVFGGVVDVPGGDYKNYLIAGILVQTLAFGMMGPGMSIATDLGEGMVDRIRSLPTSRSAYLVGHVIAELAAALLGLVILMATGFAVGWSIDSSVAEAIGGIALLVLFAAAMVWLGTALGTLVRSPDAVQGVAFMTIFPLTFLSNAFVPTESLGDGLRQVAEWNPFSSIVAAARTLFGNPTAIPADAPWPLTHPVTAAVIWSVVFLGIAVPLTIAGFRRRTTE
jgi:ABC-2 type transport system permease protein